jgi:hypothetical protein
MQFFETVARYSDVFKVRKDCIMPTLEAMIDPRYVFFCLKSPPISANAGAGICTAGCTSSTAS